MASGHYAVFLEQVNGINCYHFVFEQNHLDALLRPGLFSVSSFLRAPWRSPPSPRARCLAAVRRCLFPSVCVNSSPSPPWKKMFTPQPVFLKFILSTSTRHDQLIRKPDAQQRAQGPEGVSCRRHLAFSPGPALSCCPRSGPRTVGTWARRGAWPGAPCPWAVPAPSLLPPSPPGATV